MPTGTGLNRIPVPGGPEPELQVEIPVPVIRTGIVLITI
jgi:hypothetical protein